MRAQVISVGYTVFLRDQVAHLADGPIQDTVSNLIRNQVGGFCWAVREELIDRYVRNNNKVQGL